MSSVRVFSRPQKPVAKTQEGVALNWPPNSMPRVTVWVASFNHAAFISRCLDGIFSQITQFPFEVVVRDDFSTDGTRDILEYYKSRYPALLRLLYTESNQWIRDTGWADIALLARGSAVALIDGDDYWCDPHKLSRQFEALLLDPSLSLVSCSEAYESEQENWQISIEGGTSTWMFRKAHLTTDFVREANGAVNGDIVLKGWLEQFGREERLDFVGSVWGRNENGITRKFRESQKDLWRLDAHIRLARLFAGSDRVDLISRQEAKIRGYLFRLVPKDNRLEAYEQRSRWRTRMKWIRSRLLRAFGLAR